MQRMFSAPLATDRSDTHRSPPECPHPSPASIPTVIGTGRGRAARGQGALRWFSMAPRIRRIGCCKTGWVFQF